MSKLLRPTMGAPGSEGSGGPASPCPWIAKTAPTVWEYMVESSWGDGAPRKTSTLMVVPEDGLLKVGLHERDTDAWLWATGESLQAALKGLESRLASGKPDWRPSKQQQGKRGK